MDNKLELTRKMRELICQGDTIEAEEFLPNFSKTIREEVAIDCKSRPELRPVRTPFTLSGFPSAYEVIDYPLIPGAVFSFTSVIGEPYSIRVEEVTDTDVRLRNTRVGCMAITISHKAAYDLLQDCSKVQPLDGYSNGTIPT